MKAKKINTLTKKSKPGALGVPDLVTSLLQESPFSVMSKAEAQAKFERALGNGTRWVDSDEYRRPAPLGPMRMEFDEDGVPTYLE